MTHPYYEIVTYTAASAAHADTARIAARDILRTFPGFIAWTAFSGAADPTARVDLVAWESLEHARAAAGAVGSAPEFADFRASVARVVAMEHYVAAQNEAHPVVAGSGVEVGRFRLKSGVTEEQVRRAHAAMVANHLSAQPGWRREHLVNLGNGVFLDLAFADTPERAHAICASWQDSAECAAFLALIEPESMEFGTVL